MGIIGQLAVGQQRASRLIVDDRGNTWRGGRQRIDNYDERWRCRADVARTIRDGGCQRVAAFTERRGWRKAPVTAGVAGGCANHCVAITDGDN